MSRQVREEEFFYSSVREAVGEDVLAACFAGSLTLMKQTESLDAGYPNRVLYREKGLHGSRTDGSIGPVAFFME